MEIFTVTLFLIIGIILLLVEFLLIPGLSVAGIGCLLSFGASVFFAFRYWGTMAGIITLITILIIVPLILYYLFKSKAVKPMMLSTEIDGKIKTIDENKVAIGDTGKTIGRLAPMGKAKINGQTVEARSLGIYIEQDTEIKVLKIEGNTIIVEPINK